MKLLLDQGLPRSAVEFLSQTNVSAVHVSALGMSTASDREILDLAVRDSFVVVTLDADFHMLLALSDAGGPSVVRIRIEGLRGEALAETLIDILKHYSGALEHGAAITVGVKRTAVRRLPFSNSAQL